MADIEKIRRNIGRMIDQQAPESDIDEYIKSEGVTLDQVRSGGTQQMEGYGRIPAMAASNAAKGLIGTAGLPATLAQTGYNAIGRTIGAGVNYVQRAMGAQETPYQDISIPGTSEKLQGAARDIGLTDRPDLKPQNMWEKIVALASEGAGAGAPFRALGGHILEAAGAGALGNIGAEAAAGTVNPTNPYSDMASRVAGGVIGAAVPAAATRFVGKTAASITGPQNEQYQTFQRQGVRPTPSDVTPPGSISSKLESATGRAIGGGPVVRANQGQISDIEQRASDMASQFGAAAGKEEGGRAIQGGIQGFRERFKGKFNELDQNLAREMPADTIVQPRFLDAIRDMKAKFGSDQNTAAFFENPDLKRLLAAAESDVAQNGGLRFGTLMQIRSEIGNMLNDQKLVTTIDQGKLRSIYGAVKDDISSAVKATGNQKAIRANELRDSYYAAGAKRMNEMQPFVREGLSPEQTFDMLVNSGKRGATRLWQFRRSMEPDEWNQVAGNAANLLGKAGPDAEFSLRTFFSNTNKMSDEAMNAMFGGATSPTMPRDLRELSKIAKSALEGNKAVDANFAGNSWILHALGGVGGTLAGAASGGPWMTGLAATAGSAIVPNLTARVIASPAFVRWLATPVPWEKLPGHIENLTRLSAQAPEIASDINAIQKDLLGALNDGRK